MTEKLQAIASPWADWISLMDTRFVSSDNGLTTIIDVDMKRGRDFQSLAQLVYCCDNYPEHSIPTAPKMEQWVARAEHPPHAFKTAINDVLTSFWHIASDRSLNAAFTKIQKRVAPIEFVFIGMFSADFRCIERSQCTRSTRRCGPLRHTRLSGRVARQ